MDLEKNGSIPTKDKVVTRAEFAALMPLMMEIRSLKGRTGLATTCPYCKETITTQITAHQNKQSKSSVNRRFGVLAVILIISTALITFSIFHGLLDGEFISKAETIVAAVLFTLLVVAPIICFVVGYICLRNHHQDIKHSCPMCFETFGVNSGLIPFIIKDRSLEQH